MIAWTNELARAMCLMPLLGSERLARRQDRLYRRVLEVHRRGDHVVAPPGRRVDVIQGEGEEDDECAQREAEVEPGAGQEIQPAPPAEVALLDEVLEDETHDAPREVVEGRGRRNRPGAAEDHRGDQVLHRRLGPAPGAEVEQDGENGADTEEDEEPRVDLAGREHARWAEETPDNRGWEERMVRTKSCAYLGHIRAIYSPEKKTLPPGHVKCSRCVGVHTSGMLLSAEFKTMIWMKHEKVVATT